MPKRKNRLNAIDHERRQMAMLKDLEPNATPEEYRDLSNTLLDIAQEALGEVHNLEMGESPNEDRVQRLGEMVKYLSHLEQR